MIPFSIFAIASLFPGLGLLILKKWIQGLMVIFFFIILGRAFLYAFNDGIAIFLLIILAAVWVGQFIYSVRLYQGIQDWEYLDRNIEVVYDEDDAFLDDEIEIDPEREYLEGPEIPPEYYLEPSTMMVGWPGNRTRPGRSGYDPLEYRFEWAHMQGCFIHHLITGSLISRRPVYQVLLGILGTLCVTPSLLALILGIFGDLQLFLAAAFSIPLALVGLGFLVSLFRSLSKDVEIDGDEGVSELEPVSDRKVLIGEIVLFSLIGIYILGQILVAILRLR